VENERGSWGSNIGFLLAAIGSAVGLGNIWGFPYKMGKSGGFTFLLVYLALAVFVGFIIMMSELALGRKTGASVVGAYHAVSRKFKWIGWLAMLAPFLIMSFYSVLGGYCIEYMSLNLSNLAFSGAEVKTGSDLFGAMLTNPFGCAMFTILFLVVCLLIVKGGISGGIEKFNNIGMPALFIMLVIIIIRSLTLPGATEGLKFMFVPGYAVKAGFISEAPGLVTVLSTAGGQMFFSLSLAMGAMVTYGSYLDKKENLVKNSAVIVVADTLVALMAGVAVIPAAVANGIAQGIALSDIKLGGPSLLFVTLQDVFQAMGRVGPLFGVIFYLLVLIAAISSAISLMEVLVTFFLDRAKVKGRTGSRSKITLWVSVAILAEALLVAVDGLGSNGLWLPGQGGGATIAGWNDCWLDFMDCWSEGIMMPLGAMLMALMIGWEIKPKSTLEEINHGVAGSTSGLDAFYSVCIKFVVPVAMAFILAGQMISFFGEANSVVCYIISIVILFAFWVVALLGHSKKEN
jgi:NSS family neurotransmitter:Na+ symporter